MPSKSTKSTKSKSSGSKSTYQKFYEVEKKGIDSMTVDDAMEHAELIELNPKMYTRANVKKTLTVIYSVAQMAKSPKEEYEAIPLDHMKIYAKNAGMKTKITSKKQGAEAIYKSQKTVSKKMTVFIIGLGVALLAAGHLGSLALETDKALESKRLAREKALKKADEKWDNDAKKLGEDVIKAKNFAILTWAERMLGKTRAV